MPIAAQVITLYNVGSLFLVVLLVIADDLGIKYRNTEQLGFQLKLSSMEFR